MLVDFSIGGSADCLHPFVKHLGAIIVSNSLLFGIGQFNYMFMLVPSAKKGKIMTDLVKVVK